MTFLNNPKDLDPSYKMDLDLWDCFGQKKTLSYNQRNTVFTTFSLIPSEREKESFLMRAKFSARSNNTMDAVIYADDHLVNQNMLGEYET